MVARRTGLLPACAFLLLGLLALPQPTLAASSKHSSATVAPGFSLPTQVGTVCLDSLRGHVVYLDFWASWCGPCRASVPWMSTLARRYRERGVEVVGVNLDKDRALAMAMLAEHPAAFTVAFDPLGAVAAAYQVRVMPTSFVIAKDGTVRVRHAGFVPRDTTWLQQQIEEALNP